MEESLGENINNSVEGWKPPELGGEKPSIAPSTEAANPLNTTARMIEGINVDKVEKQEHPLGRVDAKTDYTQNRRPKKDF